jgi:BolA protein
MQSSQLETIIKQKLASLEPTYIELIDESYKHAGHAGVKEHGGRHYNLTIVSKKFVSLSLVQRHQLIYKLLADLLQKDIHALKIKAETT